MVCGVSNFTPVLGPAKVKGGNLRGQALAPSLPLRPTLGEATQKTPASQQRSLQNLHPMRLTNHRLQTQQMAQSPMVVVGQGPTTWVRDAQCPCIFPPGPKVSQLAEGTDDFRQGECG
jgi:hypothetical protein